MTVVGSRSKLALGLLGAALFLGFLGDHLFRATPLGVNLTLWTTALVASLLALARWSRLPLSVNRLLMIPVLLVFSALVVWRDSLWLVTLDLFAMIVALTVGALRSPRPLHQAGLSDYVVGLGFAGAAAGGQQTVELMQEDIEWDGLPRSSQAKQAVAVGRGLVLAAPLLLVFGALFIAADSVFQTLVSDVVPDGGELVTHIVLVGLFAWVSAGLLREYLHSRETVSVDVEPGFRLGTTELAVVFGLLNLLFLAFVLVQLRYLFGGASLVEEQTGLTYAEYARHGFFELVAVAALVLPLVLLADWLRRNASGRAEVVFRVLSGALIILLFVVMASALERMRLYQREYGLTELRLFATGFMIWLAVVFVWAGVTIFRGRRDLFAVGALISGFAAILVMNAINPDALIARTNLDRPKLDPRYLTKLSDDATPTLVRALPTLTPEQRLVVETELRSRRRSDSDWRSWNWSRARAQDELKTLP